MQVDPDKAFAVQIQHDESVVTTQKAYVQCAVLYTSGAGERRIRCAAAAHLVSWPAAALCMAMEASAALCSPCQLVLHGAGKTHEPSCSTACMA